MVAPTAADVRSWSQVDFAARGFPEGDSPDSLERTVTVAGALVVSMTGRPLDATMPAAYEPIAGLAVTMMTEKLTLGGSEDTRETAADWLLLASFNAGQYSETRRSPGDIQTALKAMISGDPDLDMILRQLMTPEKLSEYIAFANGENVPDFEVTEIDWSGLTSVPSNAEPYDPWWGWPLGYGSS